MVVSDGSAAVVVCTGADGFGDGDERPPMAGVAEALVTDFAGFDVTRSAGGAGDRRGAGERAESGGAGEPGRVVADLRQDAGREDRPSPGAERRIVASGCRSNSTANACSSSSTAVCIASTMAIKVLAVTP